MKQINVRIGLLGLGNIGQGVARLCAAARGTFNHRGLDLEVTGVLERDLDREREFMPRNAKMTGDADAFFNGEYDMIVEVLGGVRPAYDFVARALQKGVPVVTANKAMMAAHGVELYQLAADHNTTIRCEASAIAGVPYLSALRDRPLIARANEISGIFNGTCNYILSSMQNDQVSFDDALADAQARGYAEPDPTMDVELKDAADKLVVIVQHLGITGVFPKDLDVKGIRGLEVLDFVHAEQFGGTIKPIAYGKLSDDKLDAFVGPTFVPKKHPLANIHYVINAVRLQSPEIGDLVFSGPGAGRDVTAATILDDVVEIVTAKGCRPAPTVCLGSNDRKVVSPHTPWFIRNELRENGGDEAVINKLAQLGISVRQSVTTEQDGRTIVHVLTHARGRDMIEKALGQLKAELTTNSVALRALTEK